MEITFRAGSAAATDSALLDGTPRYHLDDRLAVRIPAQVQPAARLAPEGLDEHPDARLGSVQRHMVVSDSSVQHLLDLRVLYVGLQVSKTGHGDSIVVLADVVGSFACQFDGHSAGP